PECDDAQAAAGEREGTHLPQSPLRPPARTRGSLQRPDSRRDRRWRRPRADISYARRRVPRLRHAASRRTADGEPARGRADRQALIGRRPTVARPIIIDTDPGIDDAVAILLALASPELEVLGLVAVAGNVPLTATARNACAILELADRSDIPVHAGC